VGLPGLLIEYFITGIVSLLGGWWLYSHIDPTSVLRVRDLTAGHAAVIVPIAYVLGMVVDFVGKHLAESVRLTMKRVHGAFSRSPRADSTDGATSPPSSAMSKAELFARAPELGKQAELRQSRDRVARGVFANTVIAGIAALSNWRELPLSFGATFAYAVSAGVITYCLWRRYENLTHDFKVKATKALTKIKNENLAVVATGGDPPRPMPVPGVANRPTAHESGVEPQAGPQRT
jgi:hypothetical protein